MQDRPQGRPDGKTLSVGQGDKGLGPLLGRLPLTAALLRQRRKSQRHGETKGVVKFLGQIYGLLTERERTVRVATHPC
jgi:hypothetical protein